MKRLEMILCHDCGSPATYRASTASSWLYKCAEGHTKEIPKPAEAVTPPVDPERP